MNLSTPMMSSPLGELWFYHWKITSIINLNSSLSESKNLIESGQKKKIHTLEKCS